jgi:hypothetical protein
VLAGVGKVVLLDDSKSDQTTLETNYFVDKTLLGKPVPEAAAKR